MVISYGYIILTRCTSGLADSTYMAVIGFIFMAVNGFIFNGFILLSMDSSYMAVIGFIFYGYRRIHLISADSSYMVINGFILQWIHLVWFYNTSPTHFRVSGFTLYDCQLRLHHTSLATLCLRSRPPIGVDIYCYQPQTHGLSRVSPRVP